MQKCPNIKGMERDSQGREAEEHGQGSTSKLAILGLAHCPVAVRNS